MGVVKAAFELEVAEQGVEGKPGPRHICLSQLEGWVFFCFLNLEQKETDSVKGSGCLPRLLSSSQGLGVLHNETRPVSGCLVCRGFRGTVDASFGGAMKQ